MGIPERRARDKKEMRDKILQSAHELFLDRSFAEISIRNIAQAIEYSPATIYQYFRDKSEIFYALQTEAFRVFNDYMSETLPHANSFERLIALAERYVTFTFSYPKYYNIMFLMESPGIAWDNPENWQEANKAHANLEEIIAGCMREGYFAGKSIKVVSFTIWSYMHGICSLMLRNRMRVYPSDQRESIRMESMNQFMQLLKLA